MIKNKKSIPSESVIYSSNEIPEASTSSDIFNRDTLCLNLMKVSRKRKMAETISSRYKTNKLLSQEFSLEETTGELFTTMTQVINAWECFWLKKQGKSTDHLNINLSDKTDLSTFGMVTGYFVNAYSNNISKRYSKFKTEKRASAKAFVSLDSSDEEHINNANEGLIASKTSSLDKIEYKNAIGYIIKELKAYDKTENSKHIKENMSINDVPMKKRSYLAKLFVALMNPRYKGNIDQIRINFNWTDYIFKRNKEVLFKKLAEEYKELGQSMLNYVIEEQHGGAIGQLKEKDQYQSPIRKIPHRIFSMEKDGNKTKYSVTIRLDDVVDGHVKSSTIINKMEVLKPKNSCYDTMRNELMEKTEQEFLKVKKQYF